MTSTHDVIRRTVDLQLDRDAAWNLIATPAGWSQWLVDTVAVAPDAANGVVGLVLDGDVARRVRWDDAATASSRRVAFTWWEAGDESSMASVELEIVEHEPGRCRLEITERPAAGRPEASAQARLAWEVRVCSLWACTVAAALV